MPTWLPDALRASQARESHRKALQRSLQLQALLSTSLPQQSLTHNVGRGASCREWRRLQGMYEAAAGQEMTQQTLLCLAALLRPYSADESEMLGEHFADSVPKIASANGTEKEPAWAEAAAWLLAQLQDWSRPDQASDLRLAAQRALHASGKPFSGCSFVAGTTDIYPATSHSSFKHTWSSPASLDKGGSTHMHSVAAWTYRQ